MTDAIADLQTPAEIADLAVLNGDPWGYVGATIAADTIELTLAGVEDAEIQRHVDAILAAAERRIGSVRPWGHA